ncbi:hypothetical protein Tco_1365861, partial [Tanacetum coccineum]
PIIETLKYIEKHKKLLNSILLDKLKLNGELKGDQETLGEEAILKRGKAKLKIDKVRMLDHSSAETMRRLLNVLCQVGTTTLLADFMLLDVPIIVGIMYTCVRKSQQDSDSDDDAEEEYSLKKDEYGKPFYGPHHPPYLDSEDAMDRSLAEQDYLDPFNNVCIWKKVVSFLGSLPVSLKNTDWKPNYSGRNSKESEDRKWHVNVKIVDPFCNAYERGYETKKTDRKVSGLYKLSDIMSPTWLQN